MENSSSQSQPCADAGTPAPRSHWLQRFFASFGPSRGARAIARSLLEKPHDWSGDHYRWTHRNGLSLWVANRAYGLGVRISGDARPDDGDLSVRDRAHIWRAYRASLSALQALTLDGVVAPLHGAARAETRVAASVEQQPREEP